MPKKLLQIPDNLHKTLRVRSALTGRPQYRIVLDALAAYLDTSDDVGAQSTGASDQDQGLQTHTP